MRGWGFGTAGGTGLGTANGTDCVCGVIKCEGIGDLVLQVGLDWGLLMGLSCVCVYVE